MLKRAVLIGLTVFSFVSCHNKLEILAPYKESVVVYGLLNQGATAHYLRIQRVFLGEGNALVMAQNQDSVYFKPGDLKVTLQRIKNGAQVPVDNTGSIMEIVLTEDYIQIQTGVFNPNQLLYKTKHTLYEDSQYKLIIHNNKSGKEFTSQCALIGDFKSQLTYGSQYSVLTSNPGTQIQTVNIVPNGNGSVVCRFGSPVNAAVCGLKLRFFYTEFGNSGSGTPKSVDIDLGYQYIASFGGGQTITLDYSGGSMKNRLVDAIGIDPAVNHRTADSVHFLLNAGGYDVSLYNQVNSSTSLSQDKPNYSNITDGVGIFSSRKEYVLVKHLSTTPNGCIYTLANDPITCPLRFLGTTGALGTNCP
jgi:hypothetical protein